MKWDKAAEKAHEMLPIPPMMGPYARLQAEKIARDKDLDSVTTDIVKETEEMYRDFMGEEKYDELKALISFIFCNSFYKRFFC